jgi:glycosyltransferase involved in cell wall biosynthesis
LLYLVVVSAPARRLSPSTFAMESAFAEHLRAMVKALQPRFTQLVLAAPEMSPTEFDAVRTSFSVVDEDAEPIRFVATHATSDPAQRALLGLFRLAPLVASADLIHTHLVSDPKRPHEAFAALLGKALRKRVVSITDMDHRGETDHERRAGRLNFTAYLKRKLLYDPIMELQQHAWIRVADLVLFKEAQQVDDYGHGAKHVRLFLDPNYTPDQVLSEAQATEKCQHLRAAEGPLRVIYFGRLVPYKGVDVMVDVIARARARGANVTFTIMGSGAEEARLRTLVNSHHLDDVVTFVPPRPYAAGFFEVVRDHDVLLACPLAADTPRSAWDALASGLLVLGFDTSFYRSVARITGGVDVTPSGDADAMAARLVELDADRAQLAPRIQQAVRVTRENTQDEWLQRRVAWIEELFADAPSGR